MEHKVIVGTKGLVTKIVENADTALELGSGLAKVFATPALVALMENAAFKSIEPLLPEGFTSVGIQINIQHSKASLPGAIISCSSVVSVVDGKKIHFSIVASDNEGEIGSAEHIRFIVDANKFMERLQK